MKIIQILQDHNIQFQTEGHKHCRPGWVNMACPFCIGNPGLHLGASLDGSHFYCWRCGWKPVSKTLSKLLKISEFEAKKIMREYGGSSYTKDPKTVKIGKKKYKLPTGVTALLPGHIRYLEKRGFDPVKLQRDWFLVGSGAISFLDKIDYSKRVIAPFLWDGKEVTFQGRDITDKHPLKYMACPMEREIMHHKHILYGRPDKWGKIGLCVEGITDVWRLGFNSFATCGIEFTNKQIRIIAKQFTNVIVIFDDEVQAIEQANKLIFELRFRGVNAWRQPIEGDPGGLSQSDADHLVRSLI